MKKQMGLVLLFMIMSLSMTLSYANSATNTLIVLLATVPTMKANFTQQITDKNMRVIQQSEGTMALQKPGKFRWQETSPTKQLIIANGQRLTIYDSDLEQVTVRSLSNEIGKTPALLLSDPNHALERNFDVQLLTKSSGVEQWFVLSPKTEGGIFNVIKLGFGFAKGAFTIRGMVLQDHLGHITTIHFFNVVVDVPLSNDLFYFTPPANVDVIDETHS